MLVEDSFTVKVPVGIAWDFISNPEKFGSCLPGCERVRAIDQKTFECLIKQKIAGLSVKFKLVISLLAVNPPYHIESIVNGGDLGKAGTVAQKNSMDLTEMGASETMIRYRSDISISGKLALFGEKSIHTKAKRMAEEFIQTLKTKIESAAGPENA